ncbi:MAG: hypothetical protein AAGB31_16455, partial [Bdellovibrio sp.]
TTASICAYSLRQNRYALGINSPLTGAPVSSAPTHAVIQWISSCVHDLLFNLSEDQLSAVLDPSKHLCNNTCDRSNLSTRWSQVPEPAKKKLIEYLVFYFLGSDETILDYGLTTPDTLRSDIYHWANQQDATASTRTLLEAIIINLVVRDEYLSY